MAMVVLVPPVAQESRAACLLHNRINFANGAMRMYLDTH